MVASKGEEVRLSLRPDVAVTVLEDEAVLLDLETKYFYSINASGWAIVQLLESGVPRDQIAARCCEWGAKSEDAGAITGFIDVLARDRLLIAMQQPAVPQPSTLRAWAAPVIEKHKEPLQRIMISAFDPTLPLAE